MMNRLYRCAAFLLLVLVAVACSPLREPEEALELQLLAETPLGTSKNGVREKLRKRGLTNLREEFAPSVVPLREPFRTNDWHSLYRVNLGSYGLLGSRLMATEVIAYYVFKGDELLEIAVLKETEAL